MPESTGAYHRAKSMELAMQIENTPAVEPSQDAPEVVTEESSTPEAESAQPETHEEKKSKGVQKRIDELTANWRNEQREKEWLRQQYEMLQSQIHKPAQPVEQPKSVPSEAPNIEEFEDVNEYVRAAVAWELTQTEKVKAEAARQEAEKRQQQEFQAKVFTMVDSARQKYADFDEVVLSNPSLVISQFSAEALAGMANGADVAYHLGKSPSEAARIAQLPQPLQLVELGQIAATLKLSEKKVTAAPAPVASQLGGPAGGGEPEDIKAWMEWRNNQLRNRR